MSDLTRYYYNTENVLDEDYFYDSLWIDILPSCTVEDIADIEDQNSAGECFDNNQNMTIFLWDADKNFIGEFEVLREWTPIYSAYQKKVVDN